MTNKVELNEMEQKEVVGEKLVFGQKYTTSVAEGYLALRNDMAYKYENEIGALCNGSVVEVIGDEIGDYVLVTVISQAKGSWNRENVEGRVGYVNKNFLR